jgi:LAO/AO transport system kinase
MLSAKEYIQGIQNKDIATLSKAITLVESTKEEHQKIAREILLACINRSSENSIRIGITGVPGAGKSTFIEALGCYLVKEKKKKIAVLAIDPSSTRSKGSILGDKTRMNILSSMENVFVRPTASSGTLGGVAKATQETIILCEAAGFDTIIIETVGVGQSEIDVKDMIDFFLLLAIPGAGDELQGIKRGIVEMADAIVINKADGGNIENANKAANDYKNALHLFPLGKSGWVPKVQTCSAIENKNIDNVWLMIEMFISHSKSTEFFTTNRKEQALRTFNNFLKNKIIQFFYENSKNAELIKYHEKLISKNNENPYSAADKLFKLFTKTNIEN